MRDRLIELLGQARVMEASGIACKVKNEYIADHLIANGVIVPPCKVGDTVYRVSKRRGVWCVLPREVVSITHRLDHLYRLVWEIFSTQEDRLGKTVFLTREEAEKALAEKDAEIERLKWENAHLECVAEVAVKNRDEYEQELHYLSNVEIPYLYEALEGKGKDAEKLIDILANALKKVKAEAITALTDALEKHFCHDPAFLGVEQRLIMDVVKLKAKELKEAPR